MLFLATRQLGFLPSLHPLCFLSTSHQPLYRGHSHVFYVGLCFLHEAVSLGRPVACAQPGSPESPTASLDGPAKLVQNPHRQ